MLTSAALSLIINKIQLLTTGECLMSLLQGVALFLADGNGHFWTVVEMADKPAVGKMAGMISIPMETMEDGEEPEDALQRLLAEEVGEGVSGTPTEIGNTYFPGDNGTIAYRIFCFHLECAAVRGVQLSPGDSDDVAPHGWLTRRKVSELGERGRRELPRLLKHLAPECAHQKETPSRMRDSIAQLLGRVPVEL
jgi:8-oxo-dGTP pyrophosphatase MutT (NUDIX family)